MEGRQQDYHHQGLSSPYGSQFSPNHSEPSSADHTPASAQYQQHVKYDPDSARPGAYADYIAQQPRTYPDAHTRFQQHQQAQQAPPPAQQPSQPPSNPPMAQANPSIAASSPTYPQHPGYSPYPPQHEMPQYAPQPGAPMYAPRPDWAGHYGPPPVYGHMPGGHPMGTVYSFVPIPGAQQHKRPRRRYEEIERMYKCGWDGCEKAYGTLNHLNAHVTMQSHGTKRTPEEFKEIRKEWKAKKKEEEQLRKQDEERGRTEGRPVGEGTPTQGPPYAPSHMMAPIAGPPQLPPIGYGPAPGPSPTQYTTPSQGSVDGQPYSAGGQMYAGGYPPSPYGQQQPQMYQQRA